jgi:hypothetical protein
MAVDQEEREKEKEGAESAAQPEAPAEASPAPENAGEVRPREGSRQREPEQPRHGRRPRRPSAGKGKTAKKAAQRPSPKPARRVKPSPVPASMWLFPSFRLPFSTPGEFVRWFLTGINFWAVAAVAVCALGGWLLLGWLDQPVYREAEAALAGAQATAGLSYTVERTGEAEVTVTGSWNTGEGQEAPSPELAAALCAALSPQEIYGHSSHLYWSVARRFFDGDPYDLTVVLVEGTPLEKDQEPWEPVFTVTLPAGEDQWPEPDCPDPDFAAEFQEAYSQYWLFGQGRKEEMGPPQSDPIIEEGDRPPESQDEEEEAPPLPDLGEEDPGTGEDPDGDSEEESTDEPLKEPDGEEETPDLSEEELEKLPLMERLLAWAGGYRGLTWEEAWEKFWQGDSASESG